MEGAYGIIKVEGFVTSVLKQPVPIENSVDLLILITRGSPAMNNIFTDRSRVSPDRDRIDYLFRGLES